MEFNVGMYLHWTNDDVPRDSADCIQMQILYACIGKRHERKSKFDA